jgi:hypothetical protein
MASAKVYCPFEKCISYLKVLKVTGAQGNILNSVSMGLNMAGLPMEQLQYHFFFGTANGHFIAIAHYQKYTFGPLELVYFR